ncbi:MAG: hypothetical protein LBK69_06395, partial [Syntrophomonadaceae bacterium]|nr:hypothetical protein [Syntrophomonadaceae bacterium]
LQAEALSSEQDSEKPCECKDVLEQAEVSGVEDKEADIAGQDEVAEGIQTSLAALDIQEEIISGGESDTGEEIPLQAEALSSEQDSEKPCECKDVLEQAEESGIENKEADVAGPLEEILEMMEQKEDISILPEAALPLETAEDRSFENYETQMLEILEDKVKALSLSEEAGDDGEQKLKAENVLAAEPEVYDEFNLGEIGLVDEPVNDIKADTEEQIPEMLEETFEMSSLFEEVEDDGEQKTRPESILAAESEFYKEIDLGETGLLDEPVNDIKADAEEQILEILEDKMKASSLFEEAEDDDIDARVDFPEDITITINKDEREPINVLQDAASENLLDDVKEETAEQKPGIVGKTDDWNSLFEEINEEGDEQEKLIEEIFASDIETKDFVNEINVSGQLKAEIKKEEETETEKQAFETTEEAPVDRTIEIFEPMITKAFVLKEQGDILEAIESLESILRLNPPGELAYLIFEELEVLYQKNKM